MNPAVGDTVTVEGPYCRCQFDGQARRQIWIGGGSGISPFVARLRAQVPDWRDAELWFCGPAAFGDAIRTDLCAQGLPAARFHRELFEMR